MTKAKRVLALVLAVIMASLFCTSAFARVDYEAYKSDPYNGHLNSINVITLTAAEGATQILDKLDDLLYDLNFKWNDKRVVDQDHLRVGITLDISNVDGLLWTLWNLVNGLDGDGDCLKKIVTTGEATLTGITWISLRSVAATLLDWISLGDLENLTLGIIDDQNVNSRHCRNWPVKSGVANGDDLYVIKMLTYFLSSNRLILGKLANGSLNLGILGDPIKSISSTVKQVLEDLPGFLKDLLYSKLWDSAVDKAPSGFTYDGGAQDIINWLLWKGTGTSSEDGGKSVLGPDFEPFLEDIKDQPGKADIKNQSTYKLVNNAIQALLSGMLGDLVKGLLYDLAGAEATDEQPYGDPAIVADSGSIFNMIVGAVISLFVQNGAENITFSAAGEEYPIPRINELVDWLFGGALDVFLHIEEGKIELTDAFMSLLGDVIRMLPTLFPLLNFEVPPYIELEDGIITATRSDDTHGDLYITFEGEQVYIDPESPIYTFDGGNIVDFTRTVAKYVSDDRNVNVSDPSNTATYRNPYFIKPDYIMPKSEVYGYILKIVLNSFIDGCYFPEWAKDVPTVGAYALASLAARYLPQNNYFDRLDKYHYVNQLGQSTYAPKGTNGDVKAIPYTEEITLGDGEKVIIPRAAADIGASLGAYFLNGEFGIYEGMQSNHDTGFFEIDTNFETFAFEFLFWGAREYMQLLTGKFDIAADEFQSFTDGGVTADAPFRQAFNTAWHTFTGYLDSNQYKSTGTVENGKICNIPSNLMRPVLFNLIDNTLFTLFPKKVLPNWLADSGSPSEALIYYWLGDSVSRFDLQQLFKLFRSNSDSDAPLQQPLLTVLIRLIDRVLGTLFGGNAVVYQVRGAALGESGDNRKVFTETTDMDSLDTLLGATSLQHLICGLLYYLNVYATPICSTIFPLLASKAVKNYIYKPEGSNSTVNYLGSGAITIDELETYYKTFDVDSNYYTFTDNAELVMGTEAIINGSTFLYTSADAASQAAARANIANYDPDAAENKVMYEGSPHYAVTFEGGFVLFNSAFEATEAVKKEKLNYTEYSPDNFKVYDNGVLKYAVRIDPVYTNLSVANAAASIVSTYTKSNCDVQTTRSGSKRYHNVLLEKNYLTYTADEVPVYSTDGSEVDYNYTNFRRAALIIKNGSPRSGDRGEVKYDSNGYKALYTEDFTADQNFNYLRLADSVKDTGKFIDEFRDYTEKTLPSAYGDWLMYYINTQLITKGLYDKDDNGQVNNNVDTNPPMPSSPFPYAASSGNSKKEGYLPTVTYNFNENASKQAVVAALAYANDTDENHDVTFNVLETEAIVRLALNNFNFDITPKTGGVYNTGSKQWSNINDLQNNAKSTISNFCASIGLTFHEADADHDTPYITRKAFALFGTGISGNFGNYYTYTTDDKGNITGRDSGTAIAVRPITSYDKDGEGDVVEAKNKIQKAYIEFAETIAEYDENIKNHYDDMSWRAETCEANIKVGPARNTLQFVFALVNDAYMGTGGKNKKLIGETETEPIYTKVTYDKFQRAYEYADQLNREMNGQNAPAITASVITEAYQNLLDAWKALKPFEGLASWVQFEDTLALAYNILNGPTGLDQNGVAIPRGHTQQSLDALNDAYGVAYNYWFTNHLTLDSDSQTDVNVKNSELRSVIKALMFVTGVTPDLVKNENSSAAANLVLTHDGDVQPITDPLTGITTFRQAGIITGLSEYVGFSEALKGGLRFDGVDIDENEVKTQCKSDSGHGIGTGVYYRAYDDAGDYVRYYAVIYGDLNGDAVIDGFDKTYLSIYEDQALTGTMPSYLQAAADVDCDGDIDSDDIAKIKAHYTYTSQQGISGSVNGTIDQTKSPEILD